MSDPAPFYSTPIIHSDDTLYVPGAKPIRSSVSDAIFLTIGSDLVLWAEKRVPTVPGAPMVLMWNIGVCDSDANHLSVLGVLPADTDRADVMAALAIAERTAVRLFPNHLLTPLES